MFTSLTDLIISIRLESEGCVRDPLMSWLQDGSLHAALKKNKKKSHSTFIYDLIPVKDCVSICPSLYRNVLFDLFFSPPKLYSNTSLCWTSISLCFLERRRLHAVVSSL